ncbi:MAG: hypothetical protein ACRYFR_09035 [Janthinobacterium lividum]
MRLVVALAALNVLLSYWLPETQAQRNGVQGPALWADPGRAVTPFKLWARLQAKNAESPGIRRLVLTQVALTLSTGYYFYFVPFVSRGPLHLNARDISYLFMYFGGLSAELN